MVPSKQSQGLTSGSMTIATTIALILALLVAACAIPEEGFDGSLEGDYYINGVDPQGVEYSGLLTIAPSDRPDTYEMQWIITGSVQQGIGRVQGSRLTADWDAIEGYDTESYGTASYEITAKGELVGERTVAGQTEAGSEEAFPIR
jgi:hypothetical protein